MSDETEYCDWLYGIELLKNAISVARSSHPYINLLSFEQDAKILACRFLLKCMDLLTREQYQLFDKVESIKGNNYSSEVIEEKRPFPGDTTNVFYTNYNSSFSSEQSNLQKIFSTYGSGAELVVVSMIESLLTIEELKNLSYEILSTTKFENLKDEKIAKKFFYQAIVRAVRYLSSTVEIGEDAVQLFFESINVMDTQSADSGCCITEYRMWLW